MLLLGQLFCNEGRGWYADSRAGGGEVNEVRHVVADPHALRPRQALEFAKAGG